MKLENRVHYKLVFSKLFFFVFIFNIFLFQDFTAQIKYNFKTATTDFKDIISQPKNWNSSDIISTIGVTGLTYGIMHLDRSIQKLVLSNQGYRNSIPVEFGRMWGEPWATVAIGGSFYLQGLATNNYANKKIGFEIGEAALYTSIITLIFKYSFGRERPRENNNPFSFFPFSFKDNNFVSLSSGHTALAFSLSTILAKNTSKDYLKVLSFIPAFMTAFSRVYQNHHWTSDVILGGIIGITVAEFITKLHKPKIKHISESGMPQTPIPLLQFKLPL